MRQNAALYLSDGSLWCGEAFGATATSVGEVVFHTGHQGYQEILTDPSYARQILLFTSPQIGNQGFSDEDFESDRLWASGVVVRDLSDTSPQWRKTSSLDAVLKKFNRPGISKVDTRRLTLHLREAGTLWGVISTETSDRKVLAKKLGDHHSMEGLSLTREVTTSKPYRWVEPSHSLLREANADLFVSPGPYKKCVVVDFGVKRQILRYLVDAGFENIVVVPASTQASEILDHRADLVLLSNGPGDPAAEVDVISEVKKLLGQVPLFGICLGHQILGLSLGLQTFKLKFGHHAANHPVKNISDDFVEITSQNHGFALPNSPMELGFELTHLNLNDQTVEGFRNRKWRVAGVQFHPEGGPGPLDSVRLFQKLQRGEIV